MVWTSYQAGVKSSCKLSFRCSLRDLPHRLNFPTTPPRIKQQRRITVLWSSTLLAIYLFFLFNTLRQVKSIPLQSYSHDYISDPPSRQRGERAPCTCHWSQVTSFKVQSTGSYLTIYSGGIGSAIARALAAEGCDVVLHCNSSLVRPPTLSRNCN